MLLPHGRFLLVRMLAHRPGVLDAKREDPGD
jgi:hypothetical protein